MMKNRWVGLCGKGWRAGSAVLAAALLVLSSVGCSDAPVGSKRRPFTMYFVPSVDAQTIATNSSKMTEFVSKFVSQKLYGKDTGFYIKGSVPSSYIAVIEAFGTKKADFAAVTTFSYILARDIKKYPVEALFAIVRGDGEKTYKSQIIARADSGIQKLEDLKGKKFAFTDPASTSGYILPQKKLKDMGITLGETVFAQKHDNVVTMVYQKQVDAGATYYSSPVKKMVDGKETLVISDARARVMTQFPDVEQKVKIIGFSEDVPNEPWIIRSDLVKDPALNDQMKSAVREGILEFAKTPEGREAIIQISTATGLVPVSDSEYDGVRKVVLESNMNIEEQLLKESAPKKK